MDILISQLQARRTSLVLDIQNLSQRKLNSLRAIELCDYFIESAAQKIKSKAEAVPFWLDKLTEDADQELIDHGVLSLAGKSIPDQFSSLSHSGWGLNEEERKVCTYIRHQLFLGAVAEVDDFLSQVLLVVLRAYPEKASEAELPLTSLKLKDISTMTSLDDLLIMLGLNTTEKLLERIDSKVYSYVRQILYEGAFDQIKKIRRILGANNDFLHSSWLAYVEIYSRRNAGIHNGWMMTKDYKDAVDKINKLDGRSKLLIPPSCFLGFDSNYFFEALGAANKIVREVNSFCAEHLASNLS